MKRFLDIAGALLALAAALPVLAACMVAIRLTSAGPALYSQWRLGRGGSPFRLWKLRSMYVNAPDLRNADGSAVTKSGDPRVTPLGRFLRSTSVDEVPQLWNVLCGNMSLVGPRPDLVDQARFYTDAEKRKFLVRPGLTGLAQINGRNAISWQQRKTLDLEYVERHNLWLDLKILWKTIPYVCTRKHLHTDDAVRSARLGA